MLKIRIKKNIMIIMIIIIKKNIHIKCFIIEIYHRILYLFSNQFCEKHYLYINISLHQSYFLHYNKTFLLTILYILSCYKIWHCFPFSIINSFILTINNIHLNYVSLIIFGHYLKVYSLVD